MGLSKGTKQLKTLVEEQLAGVEAGLCEHILADRLQAHSAVGTLPKVLGKLMEKGKVVSQDGICKRDGSEHAFYVLTDQPAKKEKEGAITVRARGAPAKEAAQQGIDLSKMSVDELSQEIFDRCMEIQRRLRGGSWVFQDKRAEE
jgi:hypothetical protein